MSTTPKPKNNPGQPIRYQIKIEGYLGPQWVDWFEGLIITQEESGKTLLTGLVRDQSALYGLLKKVRDLGMALYSVNRTETDEPLEPNDYEGDNA